MAEGRLDPRAQEIAALARRAGVPVFRNKPAALSRLAPGLHHQGIVAEVSPVGLLSLEELLARIPSPSLLVALDQIRDPRNFGAIARSVDGAGGQGIVVHERGQAPPSPAAVTASAGALLHLPLARVTNLAEALRLLKDRGIWAVGLAPSASLAWYQFDFRQPVVIVVGSEDRGLRPRVAGMCDVLVSLPQLGRVSSLNVSVAAGAVLYEAVRQRQARRG
jgi:23S rRNA (guanosine2251-2'-O)-methyltransferase